MNSAVGEGSFAVGHPHVVHCHVWFMGNMWLHVNTVVHGPESCTCLDCSALLAGVYNVFADSVHGLLCVAGDYYRTHIWFTHGKLASILLQLFLE